MANFCKFHYCTLSFCQVKHRLMFIFLIDQQFSTLEQHLYCQSPFHYIISYEESPFVLKTRNVMRHLIQVIRYYVNGFGSAKPPTISKIGFWLLICINQSWVFKYWMWKHSKIGTKAEHMSIFQQPTNSWLRMHFHIYRWK